jgi:hypothetical protein
MSVMLIGGHYGYLLKLNELGIVAFGSVDVEGIANWVRFLTVWNYCSQMWVVINGWIVLVWVNDGDSREVEMIVM